MKGLQPPTIRRQIPLAILLLPALLLGRETLFESRVSAVTVYSDRAQVTRSGARRLPAGEHRLVFDSLPASIDHNSLQLDGTGQAILRDLTLERVQLDRAADPRRRELLARKVALEDSVGALDRLIQRARSEKNVVESIMTKLTDTSGETTDIELDPAKWATMTAFYRSKLDTLDAEIAGAERRRTKIKDELQRVEAELRQLNGELTTSFNRAVALVEVPAASNVQLNLSYVVAGPSWRPAYDLRVSTDKGELTVGYKGVVRQSTTEDWNDVRLMLSTAKPAVGGQVPELQPWHIAFPTPPRPLRQAQPAMARAMRKESLSMEFAATDEAAAPIEIPEATVDTRSASVVFSVPDKASIAGDNQPHRVAIAARTFPAKFQYSAVPKLAPYAYLKAEAVNKSDYLFLPGPAAVFLDNAFTASTELELVTPQESFETSLGVDEGVAVEHKLVRKYRSDEGVFAKRERVIYEYELSVTNNKAQTAEFTVRDQRPISSDEQIAVTLIKPEITEKTPDVTIDNQGIIEWRFSLAPGEEKVLPLVYSIEYPSGRRVAGLP